MAISTGFCFRSKHRRRPTFLWRRAASQLGTVIPKRTRRPPLPGEERRKMPVLAICYGMQALNVARRTCAGHRVAVEGSLNTSRNTANAKFAYGRHPRDSILSVLMRPKRGGPDPRKLIAPSGDRPRR